MNKRFRVLLPKLNREQLYSDNILSLSLLQEYSKCSFENVRSKMIESSRMMTPKF